MVCLVGIEGTGSYGAGLSRYVTAAGVRVAGVDRSDRQDRRRQGKSDPLDAVSAAQSGRARARTLLALGSAQRRAKQRRAARQSLEEALKSFDRLGARLWWEKTRGELARIGGRAPSPDRLTSAEQRVAALVAAGRTNTEVAAELFLSVHTVEKALTRIYAKLGIRSRTELALRLALKQ